MKLLLIVWGAYPMFGIAPDVQEILLCNKKGRTR